MVQVMETWLIADAKALHNYCGSQFKPDKIPAWSNLEAVPKKSIFEVLEKSTADCGEKRYKKGKVSFEMLACIDPEKVAIKCPNAKRLPDYLTTSR